MMEKQTDVGKVFILSFQSKRVNKVVFGKRLYLYASLKTIFMS